MRHPFALSLPLSVTAAVLMIDDPTPISAKTPNPPPNYDEAQVGNYTLPDPLLLTDGTPIQSSQDWIQKRRPEVLRLFEEHVYGRPPAINGPLQFKVLSTKEDALGGTAIRKLVRISLKEHPAWDGLELLLYVPKKRSGPVPCFVGLNFRGNHSVTKETDLPISVNWLKDSLINPPKKGEPTDPEMTRGIQHSRWIPEDIIAAGYAVATAYYGDLEPDHAEGWKNSLRGVLSQEGAQTQWSSGDWGGIGAWAWGLSRILDYLVTAPEVDSKRCAVIGHSRLGKTALWAGARDERFSIVISNDSGEGGASLMRRNFGETVNVITSSFPHWFAPRFKTYAGQESTCPVDQHMLVALAAPRPVAIGSAVDDRWADPKGEFLSGRHAGPVYALFGKKGIDATEQPPVGEATGDFISYHIRSGPHDINAEDWKHYLTFCKRHWSR